MFANKDTSSATWPATDRPRAGGAFFVLLLAFALAFPGGAGAALSEQDLAALSKLGEAQGRSAHDMQRLIALARRADELGLPSEPLLDKIKEGMAKGINSDRIEQRLTAMSSHMETAASLLKESKVDKTQTTPMERGRAIEVLAEALGRGVTPSEIRGVNRALGDGSRGVQADTLAYAAKAMAIMKEGGLPSEESQALVAAAARRGTDQRNLLDLARELKGRGQEFRDHPARLREMRTAVEQGERMEKILGDVRERPAQPRLDRSDRPQRPERSERPERPLRPHK